MQKFRWILSELGWVKKSHFQKITYFMILSVYYSWNGKIKESRTDSWLPEVKETGACGYKR